MAAPSLRVELACVAGTGAGAALLYRATYQERMFGDGPGIVDACALGLIELVHPLYQMLAPALLALGGTAVPLRVFELFTVLCAAVGVAATFATMRGLGVARGPALLATALLALSPACWFFATTVEFHSLRLACIALAACVVVFAPWRRPALALGATVAVFPLVYLSHTSGLLLAPGWILWTQVARARQGLRPSLGSAAAVGGLLLAVQVVTIAAVDAARGTGTGARYVDLIRYYRNGALEPLDTLAQGWIAPLAGLALFAAVGFVRPRTRWRTRSVAVPTRLEMLAVGALVLPSLAFFVWLGYTEHGGYTLGVAPFLALAAGRGIEALPASARPLVALLVLVQALLAHDQRAQWNERYRIEERVRLADAALADGDVLYSYQTAAPRIELCGLGVRELSLGPPLKHAIAMGVEPEAFAAALVEAHERKHGAAGAWRAALDLSYGQIRHQERVWSAVGPYLEALERAFEQRYEIRRFAHDDWPLLRVEPRRTPPTG